MLEHLSVQLKRYKTRYRKLNLIIVYLKKKN